MKAIHLTAYGNPVQNLQPVDFHEFVNAIKELGVFWAVINAAPPGCVRK